MKRVAGKKRMGSIVPKLFLKKTRGKDLPSQISKQGGISVGADK